MAAKVELLYWEGCPSWPEAIELLRGAMAEAGLDSTSLVIHRIDTEDAAEREGFPGSPTIRVDGRDPFANGTEPVGFTCRVYTTDEGRQGAPAESQLRDLLAGRID